MVGVWQHGGVSADIIARADEGNAAGKGAASDGVVCGVDFFSLRVFAAHATGGQVSFLLEGRGSGPCWGVCVSWGPVRDYVALVILTPYASGGRRPVPIVGLGAAGHVLLLVGL